MNANQVVWGHLNGCLSPVGHVSRLHGFLVQFRPNIESGRFEKLKLRFNQNRGYIGRMARAG